MRKKAVIFGAGEYGRMFLSTEPDDIEVLAFIDNDTRKHGTTIQGIPVLSVDHILTSGADVVCVASCFVKEIVEQLTHRLGLPENMIQVVGIDATKSVLAQTDQQALRQQLQKLTLLFDAEGIQWWLDHSSLLNLIRSGEFINGMDDVDLCILSTSASKVTSLVQQHYRPEELQFFLMDDKKTFKHWQNGDLGRIKIGLGLDIQIKYLAEGAVFWYVGPFALGSAFKYYQGFEEREYANFRLRLPIDPESYLTQLYGEWKSPQPGWTYADYRNIIDRFPFFS
jgi:hypothetical protein